MTERASRHHRGLVRPAPVTWIAIASAMLLAAGCTTITPGAPERTIDGLERVPTRRIDTAYAAPGTSLAPYRRVLLDPVSVAFRPNWQRRHPDVTADDMARIRAEMARMFHQTFARELGRDQGYPLTDTPGADVLQVTASIVDLDIFAPDTMRPGERRYVISAGEMTLMAELRDSQSGAVLVRAADRERGRETGRLEIANSVTNSMEAQRAFEMWARLLRGALDEAREEPAQPR